MNRKKARKEERKKAWIERMKAWAEKAYEEESEERITKKAKGILRLS